MFTSVKHSIEHAAARAGRKIAIGFGAFVALCVGVAFLTASAWMFLVLVTEPRFAALIIGGIYTGGAFIMLALGSAKPDQSRQRPVADPIAEDTRQEPLPALTQAFITGLQAGARARR